MFLIWSHSWYWMDTSTTIDIKKSNLFLYTPTHSQIQCCHGNSTVTWCLIVDIMMTSIHNYQGGNLSTGREPSLFMDFSHWYKANSCASHFHFKCSIMRTYLKETRESGFLIFYFYYVQKQQWQQLECVFVNKNIRILTSLLINLHLFR